MSEMDFKSLEAGSKLLMSAVESIPIITQECHSMQDDMVEFKDWAKIFLHPSAAKVTIKDNIKKHLPILTLDLKKAKTDMSKGEYFKAGVILGNMVVIVTTPVTEMISGEF